MPNQLKQLAKLYDPLALRYAMQKLGYTVAGCDHTFQGVRAVWRRAAPDVDAQAHVTALDALAVHCDCEVMLNICPE
jgi:hypothetical protein